MKISYNWLKEFIDLELSPVETAEKLTLIGLEVDEVLEYGNLPKGVIIGKVLEVNNHPNADRLVLCKVDTGSEELQIVCGAPNVAAGQKVAVATTGTTLPVTLDNEEPLTIKKAKLRGEVSEGMICSESELALGDDHSGIMVLDGDLKPGTPLNEALGLSADTVFDIELTPNRPDAACHLGVARDLAAALNLEVTKPFKTNFGEAEPEEGIEIKIQNPDKCNRYVGKVIRGVTVKDSPRWLKERLKSVGIRSVNNIVDATNYVMMELGQPLHAFDLDNIAGNSIIVQDFYKTIEFETLDHVKRLCAPGTLFICDTEGPVAIAGVMGGVDSEVSDSTTDILIESAYFDPATVRKTAKQQSLQTDASYRFERGINPTIQRIAAERTAELIAEMTDALVTDNCTDVHPVKFKSNEITLRKKFTNRILGTEFTLSDIDETIERLGLSAVNKNDSSITYTAPSFRPDLKREIDLVEEVGRLYDYNKIKTPEKTAFIAPEPLSDWEQFNSKIKEAVKGLRYKEIFSNSLIPENDAALLSNVDEIIHTLNPISADMTALRPSLLIGFLQSAAYNFNRNAKGLRFFETGHIFNKSKNGPYYAGIGEEVHLLMGLTGLKTEEFWNSDPQEYDFFDLKACVESLLETLKVSENVKKEVDDKNNLHYFIEKQKIGRVFSVQKSLLEYFDIEQVAFAAEFSMSKLFEASRQLEPPKYTPVPKYPTFEFDFAVIVDANLRAKELLETIKENADKLEDIQIFDLFESESLGENRKSLAFRLSFLDKNKTLTINDIEPIIDKVLDALNNKYSATLRAS